MPECGSYGQTGWMHNRVRMISGQFLDQAFADRLDAWRALVLGYSGRCRLRHQWRELAMGCGTGVDSNMFVRIMAPLSQSEKFDAAAYIREYVPELADLT